jgi:hypothetical protein
MPLIKCNTCGHDISSTATICPNCGEKLDKLGEASKSLMKIGCLIPLIIISLIFSIFCFSMCWNIAKG